MSINSNQPTAQQLAQARAAYAMLPPVQRLQLAATGVDQAAWERQYLQQHFGPDLNQAAGSAFEAGLELEDLALEGKVAPGAFAYTPVALPSVDQARAWDGKDKNRLSGPQANEVIVKAYSQLDQSFQGYLGGNPPVANWMTYGKFAAREAGVQITRVEGTLRSLENMDPATFASTLLDVGGHLELLGDFGLPLLNDAIEQAKAETPPGAPGVNLFAGPVFAAKVLAYLKQDLHTLDHALVYGNTQIYDNIAPAFNTFLQAESQGQDGVAAVKDLVAAGKIEDPQGFVVQAMGLYQQAHQLQVRIDGGESGLEDQREAMIARADLLLGCQEQQVILQREEVFGGADMHRLMAKLTPHATLTDPTGVHQLLPNHQGNWADFQTRMGFDEYPTLAAAQAAGDPIVVKDQAGQTHYYLPSKDPAVNAGTITSYFTEKFKEPKLRHGLPRELPRVDQVNEFGGKVPPSITTGLRNPGADVQQLIDIARANGHNDWANEVEKLRKLPEGPVRAKLVLALADDVDTHHDLDQALAAATTPEELAVLASVARFRHDGGVEKRARERAVAKR